MLSTDQQRKIVHNLIIHSNKIKKGQKVLIDVQGEVEDFVNVLISEIYKLGALPYLRTYKTEYLKELIWGSSEESLQLWLDQELFRLNKMDAYIGIKSQENIFEFEDIPKNKLDLYNNKFLKPYQHTYLSKENWTLLQYPTYGMAQLAKIGSAELVDIYFKACSFDYTQFSKDVRSLQTLLNQTDKVEIISPNTHLSFSIKQIGSFICDGKYNLPDGEIFSAPVKDSVEGYIQFNCPTSLNGEIFNDVYLQFKNGKVVTCKANNQENLEKILSSDTGSKYIGEFGIGLNPFIKKPIKNLLFDEKMFGSLHLAIGQAFPMAYNENESGIHLDFVLNQQKEFGGGELYFDGKLIRKDGIFIPKELQQLNY
ncbi:aminopeptidase [Bacillus sp. SM2101]|uniref:aminopeptidase n=1 Tax=Bacillus sp. SM2101 TaxID=2805366 RepID=UPI001BDE88BC|nr:aminopeptidase [Bacillus sp. SM2101]